MTPPRALVLNGSPSPAGNSMRLASAVLEALAADSDTVHLYDERILPCRACGQCAEGNACQIDDAVPGLLRRMAAADLVLIVSPLHFTSLTAPVIALFSRLQPCWRAKREGRDPLPPRRRAGGLAVTAGSSYPNMFAPARSVAAAAFYSLSIPLAGMATAANTDTLPVADNPAALAEARELAAKML